MEWVRKAFGWGSIDMKRVDKLLAEWGLERVEDRFVEKIRENPDRDIVGTLYETLAEEANGILGKEVFRVYPNAIATQVYADEDDLKDSLFENYEFLDSYDKKVLKIASEEAGIDFNEILIQVEEELENDEELEDDCDLSP